MQFDAVVFDLDGTLIDSAPDIHAALSVFLEEQGREPVDLATVHTLIGDGAVRLIEKAMDLTGEPANAEDMPAHSARLRDIYNGNVVSRTRVYDGVTETLDRLASSPLKIGLCTNKLLDSTQMVLGKLGLLDRFEVVGAGDVYPWRKPDPRHLISVLEAMNVSAERSLYVGDSIYDARAAAGAGVTFALMEYGYPAGEFTDNIKPEFSLASMNLLPDILGL